MQTEETTRIMKSQNGKRRMEIEYQVEVGKINLFSWDAGVIESILGLNKDEVLELLDLLQSFSIKYLELPH